MSLNSILIVLWYTVQPYIGLIVLAVSVLLVCQVLARLKGYSFKSQGRGMAVLLGIALGILAMILAPIVTRSAMHMVATPLDWAALILVGVGALIYGWLIFHPALHLFRPRSAVSAVL
jgi:hypothetical protein